MTGQKDKNLEKKKRHSYPIFYKIFSNVYKNEFKNDEGNTSEIQVNHMIST